MAETTVVHSGEGGDGGNVSADIAHDVGRVEATTEHHAEALEEHGEKLENLEREKQYIQDEVNRLWQTLSSIPNTANEEMRAEISSLRSTVDSLQAKLSEPVPANGETTKPPEPEPNKAEEKRPVSLGGRVRRWLHRLL